MRCLGVLLALSLSATFSCATVQTTSPGRVGVTRAQHIHPYLVGEVHTVAAREYSGVLATARARGSLDRDAQQSARIKGIVQRLVRQTAVFRSDANQWPWEIHLLTSNDVNAWCMPGGKMMVYSGLIDRLQPSDDELAAVIGHEMAHALRLHAVERISQQLSRNVLLSLGASALRLSEQQAQLAELVTQLTFTLPNSREHEREADRIGVELAGRAGFNPLGAVTMHRKMARAASGRQPEWLSTHPSSDTRIRDVAWAALQVTSLRERAVGANATIQFPGPAAGLTLYSLPQEVLARTRELERANEDVRIATFSPSGGWLLIRGANGWWHAGMPSTLLDAIREHRDAHREIRSVAISHSGGWVLLAGKNDFVTHTVPLALQGKLAEVRRARHEIKNVAFLGGEGWLVLFGRNAYSGVGLSSSLADHLRELSRRGEDLRSVAASPSGGHVITYGRNGYWTSNTPTQLNDLLALYNAAGLEIRSTAFHPDGGWAVSVKQ